MKKQTKMILGVVLLAGAGYWLWMKSKQPKKSFVNELSPSLMDK
jgi:hypothetical protein